MKLKHECVRKTLLYLEENLDLNKLISSSQIKISKFSKDDITYTILKLSEAGYISTERMDFAGNIIIKSITWYGHQFLDTIRDNKVWKNTKEILSEFSSVSLRMVENIASQVITNLIASKMGTS